jgi:hypothetical protein
MPRGAHYTIRELLAGASRGGISSENCPLGLFATPTTALGGISKCRQCDLQRGYRGRLASLRDEAA